MDNKELWQSIKENDIKKAQRVEILGHCTVLYNTLPDGRPTARMYIRNSGKPQFNYIFKDTERMNKYVSEIANNVNGNIAIREENRKGARISSIHWGWGTLCGFLGDMIKQTLTFIR